MKYYDFTVQNEMNAYKEDSAAINAYYENSRIENENKQNLSEDYII